MNNLDNTIFKTNWISVKETQKGFQFLERKGVNSIAAFLIRYTTEWEVLVRYQPLCISNNDDSLFPCPVTGSIDLGEDVFNCTRREVEEETGYIIEPKDIIELGSYIVGTQTNEQVYLYVMDASDYTPEAIRGDGGYHESISYNKWEPLENLKNYNYSACQIGYYRIKELLK